MSDQIATHQPPPDADFRVHADLELHLIKHVIWALEEALAQARRENRP